VSALGEDNYGELLEVELFDLAADRAAMRGCRFDLELLPDGNTRASFKQASEIEGDDLIVMSVETQLGPKGTVIALLRGDDYARRFGG
jgi:hypothetical protein